MSEQAPSTATDVDIVATGGTYYRRMRYLVTVILFIAGGWFAYDGWVNYPAMNATHDQVAADLKTAHDRHDPAETQLLERLKDLPLHTETDLRTQKFLAFGLPLLGLGLLAWTLYNSRGEIRLTRDTLAAPGHPPIKLDQIVSLDQRKWDRKDVAYVDYDAPPVRGRVRLDAFVYQTDPIVIIHDRIAAMFKEEATETEKPTP